MSHLLYLMFRCDRECDGKFRKFRNFWELNTPKKTLLFAVPPTGAAVSLNLKGRGRL